MKKLVFTIVAIAAIVLHTVYALAENTYTFSDAIPRSVQEEAANYMAGVISRKSAENRAYSYAELLDIYIRHYGIYSPENVGTSLVEWVQGELQKTPDRLENIPERYRRPEELKDWVTRYAMPGDLLLYRVNGRPDKCVIYAGNGKMYGKNIDKNAVIDVRATFAEGETLRNKSGGLFAIAHMWLDIEEEAEVYIDIQLRLGAETSAGFTQKHYILWEYHYGKYAKSADYTLMEYEPGLYKLWNGKEFGVKEEDIDAYDGIHFIITESALQTRSIGKQIKIDYTKAELMGLMEANTLVCKIETEENAENNAQWFGSDLLEIIRAGGMAND